MRLLSLGDNGCGRQGESGERAIVCQAWGPDGGAKATATQPQKGFAPLPRHPSCTGCLSVQGDAREDQLRREATQGGKQAGRQHPKRAASKRKSNRAPVVMGCVQAALLVQVKTLSPAASVASEIKQRKAFFKKFFDFFFFLMAAVDFTLDFMSGYKF